MGQKEGRKDNHQKRRTSGHPKHGPANVAVEAINDIVFHY